MNILSEKLSIKYALTNTDTYLHPKIFVLQEIIKKGSLEDIPFSDETINKLLSMNLRINDACRKNKDQEYAYLFLLKSDVEKIISFLKKMDLDIKNLEKNLHIFSNNFAIPRLREKLGIEYKVPLENRFVDELPDKLPMPKGLEDSTDLRAHGFAVDSYQSEYFDVPEGVYITRGRLTPGIETILVHEQAHGAIATFPNFIPWFDESLANLMANWIYSEFYGNLSFRKSKRYDGEFNGGISTYDEYDKILASLFLLGGSNLLKVLLNYKRNAPDKVRWHLIPKLLIEGKNLDEFLDAVIKEKVDLGELEFSPILRRIFSTVISPVKAKELSPLAFILFKRILEETDNRLGKVAVDDLLCDNISKNCLDEALDELLRKGLTVSLSRGIVEPYMGPFYGTNQTFFAGLIVASAMRVEMKPWCSADS